MIPELTVKDIHRILKNKKSRIKNPPETYEEFVVDHICFENDTDDPSKVVDAFIQAMIDDGIPYMVGQYTDLHSETEDWKSIKKRYKSYKKMVEERIKFAILK